MKPSLETLSQTYFKATLDLYYWLAHNPGKTKSQWFEAMNLEVPENECYACALDTAALYLKHAGACKNCPIKWGTTPRGEHMACLRYPSPYIALGKALAQTGTPPQRISSLAWDLVDCVVDTWTTPGQSEPLSDSFPVDPRMHRPQGPQGPLCQPQWRTTL